MQSYMHLIRSDLTFILDNISLNQSKVVFSAMISAVDNVFMSFWVSYPVHLFHSDRDFLICHWSRCPLKKKHSALSNAFVGHFTFNLTFLTCKMSKRVHMDQNKALSSNSVTDTRVCTAHNQSFAIQCSKVFLLLLFVRLFSHKCYFAANALRLGNVTLESADVQRNGFVINKRLDDWIVGKTSSLLETFTLHWICLVRYNRSK